MRSPSLSVQSGAAGLGSPLILDDPYDLPETAILSRGPDDDGLLACGDFALLSMSSDGKSVEDDLPG